MKSVTSGANSLTAFHGAVLPWLNAAVMLGVPIVNCFATAYTIRFFLSTEVPAPVAVAAATGVFTGGVTSSIGVKNLMTIIRTYSITGAVIAKGFTAADT